MTGPYVGRSVARVEDAGLLRGEARFLADLRADRMVYAVFVRSTEARAEITSIDISAASDVPGVLAVLTARDLSGEATPLSRMFYNLLPSFAENVHAIEGGYREPILADDSVSRVGQAIALVVATDRYAAEEARDLVVIEYEPRTPIVDPFLALEDDAELVDPDSSTNLHSSFNVSVGDVDQAERDADRVIERDFTFARSIGSPMENRGVLASWDDGTATLQLWSTTQIPFVLRGNLAECLNIADHDIEVLVADMGGSFGGGVYPEEVAVAHASRLLKRPVQWLEERSESIVNSRHSRDQSIRARIALDRTGMIRSLRLRITQDSGAHNPFGVTLPYNIASHARSVYRIENFFVDGRAVLTNKTRNTPVRGAGRPEATFVIDRLIDIAAAQLQLDPADVRRTNLIAAADMPYRLGMMYRDGVDVSYESGDFPQQFERLLAEAHYEDWRRYQQHARAEGRLVGIGLSCHVEGTGLGPHEGMKVRVERNGDITAFTGAQPHGQSHHTVLAQVVADELSIDVERVTVRSGSTRHLPYGCGTFGSRSAVTAGSAAKLAGGALRQQILRAAADALEANTDDLIIERGVVSVIGTPSKALTFAELTERLAPGPARSVGVHQPFELSALEYFVPPTVAFGSGSHCVVIEIDPVRWNIDFLDYVTVDDCGAVLNPKVVDGQVTGGVIHGISNALFEEIEYDEHGQILNGTLVDYLLATTAESPRVRVFHENHPTPLNPLGAKGIGEGSTSSAPAALVNAICDALGGGTEINSVPVRPWDLVRVRPALEQEHSS